MGLFKKKPDPISERARELNAKIAALESEISRLTQEQAKAAPPAESAPQNTAVPAAPGTQPRLRSTALPHGRTITPAPGGAQEIVFEELDQQRLKREPEAKAPAPDLAGNLGVRRNGLLAFYHRIIAHFHGPATTNPKLVNYLAAGSIQGLRPLRYEKRIARNRFILLAVILIAFLWGLIALLVKHNK